MEIKVTEMSDETLEKQKEKLEDEIERRRNEPQLYALTLLANTVLLCGFKDRKNGWHKLGYISSNGSCHFLNCNTYHENREKWLEHGGKVDNSEITWNDGIYRLWEMGVLRNSSTKDNIFDFETDYSYKNCEDENLKRYEYDKRIKRF